MANKYQNKHAIERFENGEFTYFLDGKKQKEVLAYLHKQNISYRFFSLYEEMEKKIIYSGRKPKVTLLEILCDYPLTHPKILGSLYGLQISDLMFGDILIGEKNYVLVLNSMVDYLMNHWNSIGNYPIKIQKRSFQEIEHFKRTYEKMLVKTSSLRMDQVLAKLLKQSRKQILNKMEEKEVFLNDEMVLKISILLKEGDVFSIRRYGKYKLLSYEQKQNTFWITIQKYC